jgi:hypothetical protein
MSRCPCCGSRQFVMHDSRRICTYCRNEQDSAVGLIEVTSLEDTEPRFIEQWQANSLSLRAERYLAYGGAVIGTFFGGPAGGQLGYAMGGMVGRKGDQT